MVGAFFYFQLSGKIKVERVFFLRVYRNEMVNAYEIMLREKYELMFPGTEYTLLVKKGTKKPLKRYYKYDDINDTTAYYWTVKGLRVYECYVQAILSH